MTAALAIAPYVALAGGIATTAMLALRWRQLLAAGYRLVRRARLARARAQATREPVHTGVVHVGANPSWARELHDLRDIEVCPELVSDIETELRWGLIWHDFEQAMQASIDAVFLPALDALTEVHDFAELYELLDLPRELVTV